MLAKVNSCALQGMEGYRLTVEVDVGVGLSAFEIVGLPDAAVRESRERVRAAVKNSGFDFPLRRITVNLAPADVKKEGPSLDLPIAVGILAATGQIDSAKLLPNSVLLGELSLDGAVRPVSGVLPMADSLRGAETCLLTPAENAEEAAVLGGAIQVYAAHTLAQVARFLNGQEEAQPVTVDAQTLFHAGDGGGPDMSEVRGQQAVKRALEVAAAGGHNLLMMGPPGSGKTMLAKRLLTIMPRLTLEESIAVTKVFSAGGMLPTGTSLITARPFRSPHHLASAASIIGGGITPKPGEISLASHGILFLDEFPEFRRDVLEALRQPLEEQRAVIARANSRVEFPADFQLVAAMNPCPCGYWGDSVHPCTCTPYAREHYLRRISGPLLDRIDLHVLTPRVEYKDLSGSTVQEETSAQVRARVEAARAVQAQRFAGTQLRLNARMGRRELLRFCALEPAAEHLLEQAFSSLGMSARAHDRVLKVARTIADLADSPKISAAHLAEALQYRALDRNVG